MIPPAPPADRRLARWIVIWLILLAIPIVPFAALVLGGGDPFESWARAVAGRPALAAAVCFSLLVSDVFLPIPSSLVSIVSGQSLGALAGGMVNWLGLSLGHAAGFLAARRWGRPLAARFVGSQGLKRAGDTSATGAAVALILTRPVPVLAEAFSMFAGLTSFGFGRFLAILLIANAPHSFIYSWAGAAFQHEAPERALGLSLAVGVIIPASSYLTYVIWSSRQRPS